MAESYKKEAKIEINAVFDDESLIKKLSKSIRNIEDSTEGMETNIQESVDDVSDSLDGLNSSVDNSVTKLDEEKFKVQETGEVFKDLEDAKRGAENANVDFADSAESGAKKLDKESNSANRARASLARLADRTRYSSDSVQALSNRQEKLRDVTLSARKEISAGAKSFNDFNDTVDDSVITLGEEEYRVKQTRRIYDSYVQAKRSAKDATVGLTDGISRLSGKTSNTNNILSNSDELFSKLKVNAEKYHDTLSKINKENSLLGSNADSTSGSLGGEGRALENIIDSGDGAAQMKKNVSEANRKLGGISRETAKDMNLEADAIEVLANAGFITSNSIDEVTDSSRSLSRTLSAANESVDETGDSLRAAAEIGDIFEDGLGSLSVNLGAFTIALRNFLTQIPLLITALGAAAEAAAGAASAFIAVAGAIAGAIGAGAIARARQLKEEYSQIENLGESIQVIFQNVKDTFLEAAEPALNRESIELFRRSVEGTASVVNMLAQMVEVLMQSGEDYSLQDAFDDLGSEVLPEVERVVNALIYSFRTLGEETIGVLGIITGALADLIVKSTDFVARIEDLGTFVAQFRDTVSALSELGLAVGSGLIPVFSAFSSVMEGLANALNQVDDEFVANLVTFSAAIFAFSKLSGVTSTLVTILPNLALGFSNVASNVLKADSAFKAFQATVVGTNTRIANFLSQISAFSGVTALVGALGGMGERFRQIAFRSSAATARFEALALGTNVTAQQLHELAVAGNLSRDMMERLEDEAENINEELRRLQLNIALTDEQFGTLGDDIDVDVDEFADDLEDPGGFLDIPEGGLLSRFIGDTDKVSEGIEEARQEVARQFARGDLDISLIPDDLSDGRLRDSLNLATLAQVDFANASNTVRERIDGLNLSSKSLTDSIITLGSSVLRTASMMAVYTANLYKTIAASLWTLATTGSLSQAFAKLKTAKIADTIATYAQSSALVSYIGAANLATISTYALMAALTKLTLGAYALVAAVGALAVGLITNFEKVKSAGSGALSSLMPLFGAIKDVLLTTFVETWNVIVSAVTSLITIFSPLINVVKDFLGIFGLLSGTAEEGSDSFSLLGLTADIIVGALKALSESLQIVFAIVGVLGKAFMLLLVTPLKIAIGVVRGLAESLNTLGGIAAESQLLQEMFTGVENLISLLSDLRDGFYALPDNIEDAVNFAIGKINDLIDVINNIPLINIGEVSEVELTGGGLETDREELATDTAQAREGIQEVASNTINMKTENNQTVNQTVNADPEDKSTVSRVVEDAIERANRFERGRAAGQ